MTYPSLLASNHACQGPLYQAIKWQDLCLRLRPTLAAQGLGYAWWHEWPSKYFV